MSNLYLNEHHRHGPGFWPERHPVNDHYLNVYYDAAVMDFRIEKNIAMLLEPESLVPEAYSYVIDHYDRFKYVFTHSSRILREVPNARFLNWSNVWCTTDSVKNKGISLISSWKNWCELHRARIELARFYENRPEVDVFGSYRDKDAWVDTKDAHEHYKFAIVIENDLDDYWYTEKILNCFSNKVVPIYVGASRIGDIFNSDGIIQVDNWRMIPEIVRTLDVDSEYAKRQQAIEDNFNRVIPYTVLWTDRFMNDYEWLLEDYLNE